jgi:hypothetical protein
MKESDRMCSGLMLQSFQEVVRGILLSAVSMNGSYCWIPIVWCRIEALGRWRVFFSKSAEVVSGQQQSSWTPRKHEK